MKDIPVILICYNRPMHTKQVLDSLREHNIQNLFIFSDAPKTQKDNNGVLATRNLIQQIDWTKPEIIYQKSNQGLAKSIITAANYVFQTFDRLILLEDDCVPQKYFFDFMKKCLSKYENNQRVFGINGYTVPIPPDLSANYPFDIYFYPRIGSWGWGTWKRAWQYYDIDLKKLYDQAIENNIDINQGGPDIPRNIQDFLNGDQKDIWTLNWVLATYINKAYYIYPTTPQIQNIGCDGSGVHCGQSSHFDNFQATKPVNRLPDDYVLNKDLIDNYNCYFGKPKPKPDIIHIPQKPIIDESKKIVRLNSNNSRDGKPSITYINTHDSYGGAAKVALTLKKGLSQKGYKTKMLVGTKHSDDPDVRPISGANLNFSNSYDKRGYLDYDITSTFAINCLDEFKQSDLVHYHNLHGSYFNLFALPDLTKRKPSVWTLHDMQALTGHCAHAFDCEKWKTGCGNCHDLEIYPPIKKDVTSQLWHDKQQIYDSSEITIVVPSVWLKRKVEQGILKNKKVELIYNGVDTDLFHPNPKREVRKKLGFPEEAVILMFSASGGINSIWRDGQGLAQTINYLTQKYPSIVFLNVGSENNSFNTPNTINVGQIKDEKMMAIIYSAADLFLFPSLGDNCPLAVIESMACGLPTVTYETGGIPEIVDNGKTGIIVEYRNREKFAQAAEHLILNEKKRVQYSQAALERAKKVFDQDIMLEKYLELYQKVVEEAKSDSYIASKSRAPVTKNIKTEIVNTEGENKYLVSAIVSTYNSESYIRQCLEDLEQQTIADQMEIIVVDSGSTQDEESIVEEFQQRYNNIKYIKTSQRETIYKAWNRAIKEASGKYITNANTDDRHSIDALEKMAKALESHPDKALVYADDIMIKNIDGQRVPTDQWIHGPYSRHRLLAREAVVGSHPMWRRKIHEEFGYFDEAFFVSGDNEFWLRISTKYDFLYLNELLGERFISEDCVSFHETDIKSYEHYIIKICYPAQKMQPVKIDSRGISGNPEISKWPEVNLWRQKVNAKLADRKITTSDHINQSWDQRINENPKLSIIITTYNRESELTANLEGLDRQTEKDFEVIVIDNGGELEKLKGNLDKYSFGICGIEMANNFGPALARNIGATHAKAELIAFLDDDSLADENLVKNTIAHFQDYNISGLRGKVLPKNGISNGEFYDLGDKIIFNACLVSSYSAFRKKLFDELDGFNELLFGFEGTELSYRICKSVPEKIKSIKYFPDIVIYHDCHTDYKSMNLKELRKKNQEELVRRIYDDISGYNKLMKNLCPGNKNENDYHWLMAGASFLKKDYPEEAIKWAQKAVEVNPDSIIPPYTAGSLCIELKDYKKAQSHLQQVVEKLSKAFAEKNLGPLENDFDNKATLGMCYADAHFKLARCYVKLDRSEEAKQIYNKLLNSQYIAMSEEQKALIQREIAKLSNQPSPKVQSPEQACDVSIVLCTKDRADLLDKMLISLKKAARKITYEVVIVEGGSTDNTLDILKKHNITKIYNEADHLGPGRHSWPKLYNFAFSKVSGKWAMFASDDIIFSHDCFDNAVKNLDQMDSSVAGGIFFYKNIHESPSVEEIAVNKFFIGIGHEFEILMNYGLIRLDYFNEVGGLEEAYQFYYADSDVCRKLYAAGYQLIPLPGSFVIHNNVLDALKKTNVTKSINDQKLYCDRWLNLAYTQSRYPGRLLWQEDLVEAFRLPMELKEINSNLQFFWRGISFQQRKMHREALQWLSKAVNNGCDHWKILWQLTLAAEACERFDLAKKTCRQVINLAPKFEKAKEFLASLPKETKQPAALPPAKSTTNKSQAVPKTGGLIFSKDRAMQLRATIESLLLHCKDARSLDIGVLFKTSDQLHSEQYKILKEKFPQISFIEETNFQNQVLAITAKYEHILFLVDDNLFVRDFKLADIIKSLQQNKNSVGFSLRLGKNTGYCYAKNAPQATPAFNSIENQILKYNWTNAQFDFAYPLEVSSSIYRTKEILPLLKKLKFNNPNNLEGSMAANAAIYAKVRDNLLCFESSVTFCNPLNMVQSVSDNRAGSRNQYSANSLAQMFEAGRAIDVSYYSNFLPNSCHQEIELKFINERRGQTADAPLITVDMAAYNAELHIKEAIDSVLNQTYKNFELLIVDDGSTDSTRDIIAAYDDNRIKYIFQKHKNLAAARNNVIKNARGKYILCLDSDDYLAPKYIEEMVAVAENHPDIDLFYPGALTLVDESSNLTGARWEYLDFEDNKILPAFLFEHGFSPIPNPGSLKRRTLFEKIRHYDDLDCTEDFALLCRNALKINFKRVDNLPTCYYRKDGKGLSLKFDVRDRITADTLNLMTKLYPPRILCPNLKGMTNTHSSKIQYYKFLASTFYKHADGYHMVKHGKFFKQYGDHYKEKLNDLINQKQITLLADHLSDSKKLLKKAQKILQKQGNS